MMYIVGRIGILDEITDRYWEELPGPREFKQHAEIHAPCGDGHHGRLQRGASAGVGLGREKLIEAGRMDDL